MFDPDHMSASARAASITMLEKADYDGIVSSHSWSDDTIYPRIAKTGGVVTPYPRSVDYFVEEWRKLKAAVRRRATSTSGIGYGADTNGFGAQAGPRGADAPNPVHLPVHRLRRGPRRQAGQRRADVRRQRRRRRALRPLPRLGRGPASGPAAPSSMADLERGPEAYLQSWERARGVAGARCRDGRRPSTRRAARKGMTPQQVLAATRASRTSATAASSATASPVRTAAPRSSTPPGG